MTEFQDVLFPKQLAYGFAGGPEWRVDIAQLASGHEVPNLSWSHSRRRYTSEISRRPAAEIREILAFFEARRGPFYAFAWPDHLDFSSAAPELDQNVIAPTDQLLGLGDGTKTTFDLIKTYGGSAPVPYQRRIYLPIVSTLRAAIAGVETAVTVSRVAGTITFASPPAPGDAVTAGYHFNVPVRFGGESFEATLIDYANGAAPLTAIEVRL